MSDHCHRNYVRPGELGIKAGPTPLFESRLTMEEERRAALDELTRISQEMGLYDEDFDNILIKRPVSPSVLGQVESSLKAPPSATQIP